MFNSSATLTGVTSRTSAVRIRAETAEGMCIFHANRNAALQAGVLQAAALQAGTLQAGVLGPLSGGLTRCHA